LAKLYLEAPVYSSSKVWLKYHPNSCVFGVVREVSEHARSAVQCAGRPAPPASLMAVSTPAAPPLRYALRESDWTLAPKGSIFGCQRAAINFQVERGMTSRLMGRHLVSVLIPAYNAAPTITHTLRSALDQSYPAIEVVVVDDGSQDGTAEIVQEIANADARVRLICQANQGVASARNAALRASRGSQSPLSTLMTFGTATRSLVRCGVLRWRARHR
jgi:hypothetical protein